MPAYDYQLLLKHLLHQGVSWAPEQEIVYRDQVRYCYRDFYQRVLRLGSALRSLGVVPGTRVGVLEWDSHRYLEMYFGIPGIGAVMHTANPGLAFEDLLYTICHAGDEIIIAHADFAPLVERLRPALHQVRKFVLINDGPFRPAYAWVDAYYEDLLEEAAPLAELPDLDEDSLATLSYTTGTTGRPKGVYFTQRQITLQTLSDCVALSALGSYGGVNKHDVYMPLTPMFHGHAWGMPYVATMLGIKQVFPGKYEVPILLRLIAREKVTFSHCVPTILHKILASPAAQETDFNHCRIIIGGAALSKSLAGEAAQRGIQVYGGYGLSETCPVLTIANLKPFMEAWESEEQLDWLVKPGFTLPLVYLKVIDASGQEVPQDGQAVGEVVVRTPWCTPSYYQEEATAEELWRGGWLHTGDLAAIDQYGYIRLVDRLKDVIKSGGEWIVSQDVERLLAQHEDVQEAAVIGVPDPEWGERPLAIVVLRQEAVGRLNDAQLKEHLGRYVMRGELAAWAVPQGYVYVDEIPKTGVGKYNKRLLRSRYAGV
ncbi:MAG: long-chain fatty acid--CoA ligase [Chloroflexi bacterium]|nr:long-chain-fatty-acid--CoA ligase [Anaerolineaceae bacterium]NMB89764.1 long-chain fatty acid--CoA ligase [Chloroflexota bacterium]